jgi:chitin-binding protein
MNAEANLPPLEYQINYITWTTFQVEATTPALEYMLTENTPAGPVERYRGRSGRVTLDNLTKNTNYSFTFVGFFPPHGITDPALIEITTPDRMQPKPPSFFEPFNQTLDQVSFFWSPGEVEGGEPRYEIRRDTSLLDTPKTPPYTDTTPEQGRDHYYCIRTFDDGLNFSKPVCVSVYFEDLTAPTKPTGLRTSNLGLQLSWEESFDSSGDITYIVDKGVGNVLGHTKQLEFAITRLEPGVRYEFGVTAIDNSDNKSDREVIHYPAIGVSLKDKRGV